MSRTEPTTAASGGKQGAAERGWDGEEEEDEEEKVTEGRERYSKQLTLQQWTHTLKSNAYPLFSQTRS